MKTRDMMLCLFVIMLSSTVLFAQNATEQGRIITDVDFALLSTNTELDHDPDFEIDYSQWDVEIGIGYTVIDNLEIGLHIGVNNESIEMSFGEATDNTMTYGLFARYYFMSQQQFKPFVGIMGGLGTVKTTGTGVQDGKTNVSTFGGSVGVAYFINTHVGVEFVGNYLIQSHSEDDNHPETFDMSSTGFHFSLGTIISL